MVGVQFRCGRRPCGLALGGPKSRMSPSRSPLFAPEMFVWSAKAEAILEKVRRARAVLDKMQTA